MPVYLQSNHGLRILKWSPSLWKYAGHGLKQLAIFPAEGHGLKPVLYDPWAFSVLVFKHSIRNPHWCFIHQRRCQWNSPLLCSAHSNTSNSGQRCIGHVRINNVTVPAICLPKHRCKAFPDIGNHGPAGGLMSSHKYSTRESFFWGWDADPGARRERDIQHKSWQGIVYMGTTVQPCMSSGCDTRSRCVWRWITSSYYSGWFVEAQVVTQQCEIHCTTSESPEKYLAVGGHYCWCLKQHLNVGQGFCFFSESEVM